MRHRDFGLLHCDPHRVTPGVTLFSPLNGKATYIIGQRGEVLHQWEHPLVNGTYIMPSFGRYEQCAELVRRIRARHPAVAADRLVPVVTA